MKIMGSKQKKEPRRASFGNLYIFINDYLWISFSSLAIISFFNLRSYNVFFREVLKPFLQDKLLDYL